MEFSLEAVKNVLEQNRRIKNGHQFTVPSPDLYPFQWLWDSCFHAIILTHYDIAAAKAEIRSVISSPLTGGMIPHINYHATPGEQPISWGRENRGDTITTAWGVTGTSSLTQPPVIALATRRIYEACTDTAFLHDVYPSIREHFEYLHAKRIVASHTPLIAIVNPDESGEDNSPRFDDSLNLAPLHLPDEHLNARLELMKQYANCSFEVATCMRHIFSVIDLPFNILYAEDLDHLAALATALELHNDSDLFSSRATAVRQAIKKHLMVDGTYRSYDVKNTKTIPASTWAQFMPLYGGLLNKKEARALVFSELLNPATFKTLYGVPTVAQNEPSFDPENGFWRGPIWMASNWFIYHGLKRYGFATIAENIKAQSIALIELSGFREQYNPISGEGLGAQHFTWGGLVIDMQ